MADIIIKKQLRPAENGKYEVLGKSKQTNCQKSLKDELNKWNSTVARILHSK